MFKFTKTNIPQKIYLNLNGILNFCFIDDLIVLGQTKKKCLQNLIFAKEAWEKRGWVINEEIIGYPTQRGVFLGLELDT